MYMAFSLPRFFGKQSPDLACCVRTNFAVVPSLPVPLSTCPHLPFVGLVRTPGLKSRSLNTEGKDHTNGVAKMGAFPRSGGLSASEWLPLAGTVLVATRTGPLDGVNS